MKSSKLIDGISRPNMTITNSWVFFSKNYRIVQDGKREYDVFFYQNLWENTLFDTISLTNDCVIRHKGQVNKTRQDKILLCRWTASTLSCSPPSGSTLR